MINTTDLFSCVKDNIHQENVSVMDTLLPVDVLKYLLSFLDKKSLQFSVVVSRRWQKASIGMLKEKKHLQIIKFIQVVAHKLQPEHACYREKLFKSQNTVILNSASLTQIKSTFDNWKENIINILKDINKEDLKVLERACMQEINFSFFARVFDLAPIYKKIQTVQDTLSYTIHKSEELSTICDELVNLGDIDGALKLAHSTLR